MFLIDLIHNPPYYVSLITGEVRSAIAPAKPQRTASLREKDNVEPIYQTTSALQVNMDNVDLISYILSYIKGE